MRLNWTYIFVGEHVASLRASKYATHFSHHGMQRCYAGNLHNWVERNVINNFNESTTKSSTNALPKRSKALTFEKRLNAVTFWHSNYQDNEELSNRCFVSRSTFVEWKHKNTFGYIPCVLHFQCIHAPSIELSHRNIGNATKIKFVQTCFGVFTRRMLSENKTAVGQVFVVSVIAMSKRNNF